MAIKNKIHWFVTGTSTWFDVPNVTLHMRVSDGDGNIPDVLEVSHMCFQVGH